MAIMFLVGNPQMRVLVVPSTNLLVHPKQNPELEEKFNQGMKKMTMKTYQKDA